MKTITVFGLIVMASVCGVGCEESVSGDLSWCGVDSLFASGVSVEGSEGARLAFEIYLEHLESGGMSFPDGALSWVFTEATYDREFKGISYWKLWFLAQYDWNPDPLPRRTLDVDENGNLVSPLGCI